MTQDKARLAYQYVDRVVQIQPNLAEHLVELTQYAVALVEFGGETLFLTPSAQNLGAFFKNVAMKGLDIYRKQALAGLNPDTIEYIIIEDQLRKMGIEANKQVDDFVDSVVDFAPEDEKDDLSCAAAFISIRLVGKISELESHRIYEEIKAANPATVWDALCIYPFCTRA